MNTVRYIKSFSKGQITIPKEFRDKFGIGDEFWLKLSVQDRKMLLEPVDEKKEMGKKVWINQILNSKVTVDLEGEIKEIRQEMEERLERNAL